MWFLINQAFSYPENESADWAKVICCSSRDNVTSYLPITLKKTNIHWHIKKLTMFNYCLLAILFKGKATQFLSSSYQSCVCKIKIYFMVEVLFISKTRLNLTYAFKTYYPLKCHPYWNKPYSSCSLSYVCTRFPQTS